MKLLFIRPLLLILALALGLSVWTACQPTATDPTESERASDSESLSEDNSESEAASESESESESSGPEITLTQLVVNKLSLVSIVYPAAYTDAEYAAAKEIWDFIVDSTGAKPSLLRDSATPEANVIEILVGDTNRTNEALRSTALPLGTYALQLCDGAIVVNGSFDAALDYAVDALRAGIREHGMKTEGILEMPDTVLNVGYMPPLSAEMFAFGSANFRSLTNCDGGCYMLYFDSATTGDFSAYYGMLLQSGMEAYEAPRMMLDNMNNYYASCTNDGVAVTMILTTHNQQARVFVEKKAENGYFSYVNDNKASVCEPLFLQVGTGQDSGMCYIFRFANGEFFIVDGGFDDSDPTYGHAKSFQRIVTTLEQYAPDKNNIRVCGWLSTHPHVDHIGALAFFAKNYYDYPNITVANVMYNHYSPAILAEAELSKVESKYESAINRLLQAGAKIHRTHTGQRMEFGDAKLEIVYTHEMRMASDVLTSGNGLSIVMRFTVAGQTFLITGDTTTKANRVMEAMYGTSLKADFYQTPHHGYGGNTKTLAGLVDPTWLLWPCCDTRYREVREFDHNAYFFGASSKVQAEFVANNKTYCFSLPFNGTNYTVSENKPIS